MFISFPPEPSKLLPLIVAILGTLSINVSATDLSFTDALKLALENAPVLVANQAQIESARQAAIPAGELPDPQLALGVDNLPIQGSESFSLSRDFMTMQRVGIMQAFPNLAKLDARIAIAEGRLAVAEAQTRLVRLQILQETSVAWINRAGIERQLQKISELEIENQYFTQSVKARFSGGTAMPSEILAPRQEAARIAERRDDLESAKQQTIAQLKRWVGSAAEQPLSGEIPDWPINYEDLSHGLHRHPELDLFMPKGKVLDAEVAEAKADKIPDWALQLAYQRRGPAYGDMVSMQVSVDLPLFADSRQEPKIAAKLAERNALAAEHNAALQEHNAMLESGLAEYQRLFKAERRSQEVLIPLAKEKVALTLAAWQSNRSDLASLITARQELIDTELKAIAAESERKQLAARLHYTYSKETLVYGEGQ
jgi:outer membrane protein TolC